MKPDEIMFFRLCVWALERSDSHDVYVRDLISIVRSIMAPKRCLYLLKKWSTFGFYKYGIALDLGWFELSKIPDQYKELLVIQH